MQSISTQLKENKITSTLLIYFKSNNHLIANDSPENLKLVLKSKSNFEPCPKSYQKLIARKSIYTQHSLNTIVTS
jgi:hypothetical protein